MGDERGRKARPGGLPDAVAFEGVTWRVNEEERLIYRTNERGRQLPGKGRPATDAEVEFWRALGRAELHIMRQEREIALEKRRVLREAREESGRDDYW